MSAYTILLGGVLATHALDVLQLNDLEGVSMQPTLKDGDLVCVARVDPADIQAGDIIAFRVPDLDIQVCHRVVGIVQTREGPSFITRGDGNFGPDDWIVLPRDVQGRIMLNISCLQPFFSFTTSLPGIIAEELVFALLLAVVLVPRVRLERRRRRARLSGCKY